MGSPTTTGMGGKSRHVSLKSFSSGEARQPVQHTFDCGLVGRTDDGSAGETRLNKYRLFLGELPKSELAMVVALPGRPDAAKRQALLRNVQQRVVDRHAAGNRAGQDLIPRRRILAEPVKRQWPLTTVYVSQRLGQAVVRDYRQDRTEDFFAHDAHALVYIEQQRGRQLPAAGSRSRIQRLDLNDRCAPFSRILD